MAACDSQTLAANSKCLAELFSRSELQAIRIYLLCSYIGGVTVSCDPQALATASRCILEQMSEGDRNAAETYLVCQLQAGGGGGGSTTLTGSGSPVGVVTPTGVGQIYTDTTTPGLWVSNGLTNASWIQIA